MKKRDAFYYAIGQRLQNARMWAGVTQTAAGYELRLTDRTVSKYENGITPVPLKVFISMCDLYQVSPADVLLLDDVEWTKKGKK